MLRPLCAMEVRFCFLTFLSILMSPERSNSCYGRKGAITAQIEGGGLLVGEGVRKGRKSAKRRRKVCGEGESGV